MESALETWDPPDYDQPPPSYQDAMNDLPPGYDTLAPLARQKDLIHESGPDKTSRVDEGNCSSRPIDFDDPTGIREYKGGKKKKNKGGAGGGGGGGGGGGAPPEESTPPPEDNNGEQPNEGGDAGQNNGDGGNDGGDPGDGNNGGDGNGDGGDGGDDWGDAWNTTTNKKDKKKKKQEEEERKRKEEEERLTKEEEERKAKEEEERKAAEAAAAQANTLSWADDADGGGDDSWAGFATVGKKKKKKGKVWRFPTALEASSSNSSAGCRSARR